MTDHNGVDPDPTTDPDWRLGALLAHALNSIFPGCCPHSCAPCAVLDRLRTDNELSESLQPFILQSGDDWDWWNAETGLFRTGWLTARWCAPGHCDLEFDDGDREDC